MDYEIIYILLVFFLAFLIVAFKTIFNKDDTSNPSVFLITSGVGLVAESFAGFREFILSIFFTVDTSNNYVSLISGFALIILGIILLITIRQRIYILNMLGLNSQKEISDRVNLKDLQLADYKVKERLIDFVDFYNSSPINKNRSKIIIDNIKNKCISFEQRSADGETAFTGMAPIPYTIYAGTLLNNQTRNRFFEYRRSDDRYYELKKKRRKSYPKLETFYPEHIENKLKEVVVALSVTRKIQSSDILQFSDLDIINICLEKPKDNVIFYIEQLEDYANGVVEEIEKLKDIYQNIEKVHLVCSIPSCLSLKIGMLLNLSNNRLPQVISYHFQQSADTKYPYGIIVAGKNNDIGLFIEWKMKND